MHSSISVVADNVKTNNTKLLMYFYETNNKTVLVNNLF